MADKIEITSFLFSLIFHTIIVFILSLGLFKSEPRRVALITDVTLIEAKEYLGQKGEEEKTLGIEKKQQKIAETIKKKKISSIKSKSEVVDTKRLLEKIEKEKAKLDIGISRENLKGLSEEEKEEVVEDFTIQEGGEVVAGGQPSISGDLATRKYRKIEWKFPEKLPEETELAIEISVLPNGIIKYVKLIRTSGYPELDNMAISQARNLQFDSLPPDAEQKENIGILLFKFGAAK